MSTATGTREVVPDGPFPRGAPPQQYARPTVSRAQTLLPTSIDVRVLPASAPLVSTATGTVLTLVPLPRLISPQQ